MLRRLGPLLLVAACASKGGEGARGQGEKEAVVPPAPEGGAWRTARGASWKEVLEDLAGADVVFVAAGDEMRLAVLQYLFDRGRLHAIGLETFPRTAQASLDDFSFQRIDEAELERRCGAIADADRPVLAFARERRLPVLGLGVEAGILDAVGQGGIDALSEEQRRSLPAVHPGEPSAPAPVVDGLRMDVAADAVVRWYRDGAPEGAQVAVFSGWTAPRNLLPERLLARSGKTYRTLVAVPGTAETADPDVFARRYADYVWFTGQK
jgi:hypothetical protein